MAGYFPYEPPVVWFAFALDLLGSRVSYSSGGSFFSNSLTPPTVPRAASISITTEQMTYDVSRWRALLNFDPDIARVEEILRPLGPKWTDKLAHSYMALNDKSYLPEIARKIMEEARVERQSAAVAQEQSAMQQKELFSKNVKLPYPLTPKSIAALYKARSNGCSVEVKRKDIVVRLKGSGGAWYLGSNNEVEEFAKSVANTPKTGRDEALR